jgi:hypothetical protein
MSKKKRVSPEVAAAASMLGRLGGQVRSARKAAAVRDNGTLGGAPRQYPIGTTPKQRRHLRNIAAQRGAIVTAKQQQAFDAVARLRKEQS